VAGVAGGSETLRAAVPPLMYTHLPSTMAGVLLGLGVGVGVAEGVADGLLEPAAVGLAGEDLNAPALMAATTATTTTSTAATPPAAHCL
jgi:hypothetical protein